MHVGLTQVKNIAGMSQLANGKWLVKEGKRDGRLVETEVGSFRGNRLFMRRFLYDYREFKKEQSAALLIDEPMDRRTAIQSSKKVFAEKYAPNIDVVERSEKRFIGRFFVGLAAAAGIIASAVYLADSAVKSGQSLFGTSLTDFFSSMEGSGRNRVKTIINSVGIALAMLPIVQAISVQLKIEGAAAQLREAAESSGVELPK